MKKLLKMSLCLSLLAGVSGCAQKTSSGRYVKNGIYDGSAEGYGGTVSVSVEFSNNAISSIDITDEKESLTIADDALKSVPEHIQSAQSVNVDVSTGATITSKAVMNAVSNAIVNAGGNPDEWNEDETGKNKTREETLSTSVAVIGGGVSGITAALRLEQLGVDTLIVEKSGTLGGSMKITDSEGQLAVTGSDLSSSDKTVESPAELYEDVYAYGNSAGNEELLHVLFTNLIKTTEWEINDLGLSFDDPVNTAGYSGNAYAAYDSDDSSPGELLAREADICGADILMNTAMTGFIKENGKIAGIQAKASSGTFYTIYADDIVLAAGSDYAREGDMPYYGNAENTGDLLAIADQDDILSTADGNDVVYLTGIDLTDGKAVDVTEGMQSAMSEGLILVNQNGERFVNEEGTMYDLSSAVINQPDQKAYLIMNIGAYRTFRREILRNPVVSDEMQDMLEEDSSDYNQNLYCKDIRDINKKFNIDQGTLLNTILSFNDAAADQSDLLFHRTVFNHKIDVGAELMVVPLCAYKNDSLGGIRVDGTLRVIDENGNAAENVYCIGSAVGGIFGERAAAGTMNTWAFVSGKLVADEISSGSTD